MPVQLQIKPQLEKLLGLIDGSLTKDIELAQKLIELMMEFQVPQHTAGSTI